MHKTDLKYKLQKYKDYYLQFTNNSWDSYHISQMLFSSMGKVFVNRQRHYR